MPRTVKVCILLLIAFGISPEVPSAQPQPPPTTRSLAIAPQAEMRFAAPWTPSAVKMGNAQELVVTREVRRPGPAGREEVAQAVVARTLVTTEKRLSHEDAVKRLEDIAVSRDAPAQFLEIDGWPAVEIQFVETLPRRGEEDQPLAPAVQVQRTITAIAAGDQLVRFDVTVLPEAPSNMLEEGKRLSRNTRFGQRANPQQVDETLRKLRVDTERRRSVRPPVPEAAIEEGPELLDTSGAAAGGAPSTGAAVPVQNGVGELEIVASANANNVVLASNQGLSFSANRGASFAAGTTGVFGLNDPSLARAASGNFYLAVIARPNGSAAHLNATGCTNAVSRSTDNGANFTLRGYSARCPQSGAGVCFPDQEHIAADAVNTSGGSDQIYAVWRNFTPAGTVTGCGAIGSGFVTSSITCSRDNGTNWTATAAIAGAGDFPRVAVGRDGAVYVTTLNGNNVLLHRFSSCAAGLTQDAGFPVTVATLTGGVACPVSGLDRCNDGNTLASPTVAPDPDNANHLFVSFAERDGSGERVVVRESFNRGAAFQPAVNVSGGPSARRFLPWTCTTGGSAWIGWYDRRASSAASNDLTEYFVGTTRGFSWNLSGRPDPQCASGWPCGSRSTNDSEACSAQPQAAGFCLRPGGGGSATRCDFSAGGCPAGETCQGGGGCPKYGDYNGIACAGDRVFAAWASATAPSGLPAGTGLRVFSSALCVARNSASIWRYTGTPCSGDSCPGWSRLDNNSRTLALAADGSQLYQLHNNGAIWRSTGTACDCGSCPGWTRLDNNSKTVALAAAGGNLYQLHNDGWIWRYTGTPCSGESCPGWQRLDRNSKTVAIAADGSQLYQLHNDGWIWRYTGTPCSGDSCPGWQRLDRNSKTVAIAAGGGNLYQLHNDGWIWRYTGTPCSGESCPGWQRLDRNSKTVAIAAGGSQLYQLHNDGWIWRYTGTPCSGESCPGWQRLDRNSKTIAIAASGDQLYQLHTDGWIWRYTGTPCSGESCPGWQRLDNNPRTGLVASADSLYQLHTDPLYQLHNDGWIWRSTGIECEGYSCPSWQMLDMNPKTVSIAAGGNQLYQRHNDGWIWRYTGTPCTGTSCPGWQRLDRNPKTVAIAAGGNQLFQLHNDGWIWRYTGTPCTGDSCPGWERLDRNSNTRSITATDNQLFQLHAGGRIWRYTGVPCTGDSCPGWQMLDNNPKTVAIVAAGKQLFQLHNDGWIWRYTGTPCSGESCPGWERLDRNANTRQILASGGHLYQRHSDGKIWRYVGPPCSGDSCPGWRMLDNNPKTVGIAAGGFN